MQRFYPCVVNFRFLSQANSLFAMSIIIHCSIASALGIFKLLFFFLLFILLFRQPFGAEIIWSMNREFFVQFLSGKSSLSQNSVERPHFL